MNTNWTNASTSTSMAPPTIADMRRLTHEIAPRFRIVSEVKASQRTLDQISGKLKDSGLPLCNGVKATAFDWMPEGTVAVIFANGDIELISLDKGWKVRLPKVIY